MKEARHHLRLVHRADINITFSSGETLKAHTQDISDGGLLIECSNHPRIEVGDIAKVIVLEIQDAVSRNVRIMRVEADKKIALEFI